MKLLCGNCFGEMAAPGKCQRCNFLNETEAKEINSLPVGTVLGERYYIGRVLGVGGFSITYKAYDMVLGSIVALKEYLPNEFSTRVPTHAKVTVYTGDKEKQFRAGQQRFVDEAKRLAKFQHRDEIVHIFDCFDDNNTSYIVMEFVDGKTLDQVMREKGKMDVKEAVDIMASILDALEEVHKIGILHRDIAPDNIMMKEDGSVKLIDFGAARYATTSHSKSLSVIIKPGYAPIEQYRSNGEQGPWTDVYGVAATLYKLITGVTPEDSMERSVKDELQKPSKLGVVIGRHTENALMNALNIPAAGRPQSAKDFKEQLLSNKARRRKTKTKKEDLGRWPVWLKVCMGLLGASVIVLLFLLQSGRIQFNTVDIPAFMIAEGKTRVPNIVNTDLEKAQKKVEEQNLVFLIVDKEYSSEIPKDKVLLQSINPGVIVDDNTKVEVTVSGGEEEKKEPEIAEDEAKVPDTQYKTEEEAIRLLEENGLDVEIAYEESDTVEVGLVISQDTPVGSIVKKGEKVTLTVSKKVERRTQNQSAVQNTPTETTEAMPPVTPPVTQETQQAQQQSIPDHQPPADNSAPQEEEEWGANVELEW